MEIKTLFCFYFHILYNKIPKHLQFFAFFMLYKAIDFLFWTN